jgi:hypothetical protein
MYLKRMWKETVSKYKQLCCKHFPGELRTVTESIKLVDLRTEIPNQDLLNSKQKFKSLKPED